MRHVHASQPDLIVAALELPIVDGIELCRRIRLTSTIPIIVLARDEDGRSELAALDAGADDYIIRPFCADTLLARMRVVLRRRVEATQPAALSIGHFDVDFDDHRVRIHGQPVRLTPKEFDLFLFMARRPNRVLAHRALLEAVWGTGFAEHSEYLRVFVGQLRKKIEPSPANPLYFITEPWIGYRFNPTGSVPARHRDREAEYSDERRGVQRLSADRL
jgi:two-component system KDP operon response regulator KdpE